MYLCNYSSTLIEQTIKFILKERDDVAKSIPVLITPALLKLVRNLDGIGIEEYMSARQQCFCTVVVL